jgi:hypothetical protein
MEAINIYLISPKRKFPKLISVKISIISVEKIGGFYDNSKAG